MHTLGPRAPTRGTLWELALALQHSHQARSGPEMSERPRIHRIGISRDGAPRFRLVESPAPRTDALEQIVLALPGTAFRSRFCSIRQIARGRLRHCSRA